TCLRSGILGLFLTERRVGTLRLRRLLDKGVFLHLFLSGILVLVAVDERTNVSSCIFCSLAPNPSRPAFFGDDLLLLNDVVPWWPFSCDGFELTETLTGTGEEAELVDDVISNGLEI
ncbi:hypothetical protein PanWU01x14_084130, partial [Parasponia andersonii]